jgi:hypothetical protein
MIAEATLPTEQWENHFSEQTSAISKKKSSKVPASFGQHTWHCHCPKPQAHLRVKQLAADAVDVHLLHISRR